MYLIFAIVDNQETVCKVYSQNTGIILSAINDIVELQKAKLTHADTMAGRISFKVSMYAYMWEFNFTVKAVNGTDGQSRVCLKVTGNRTGKENMIKQQMLLLDSMLG